MKKVLKIDVHHLTRVEGHGNIHVRIEDGRLKEARWQVVETPRFFEVILKGKHYSQAGILTSRICGICSIGHCLASLRAIERAFDVQIPTAAEKLRLLAKHGETLQSHYLHLFFLAAPDFLGLPSAIPLIDIKPEVVETAARLKGLANRLCDLVAGRTTHPVSLQPGGVTRMPAQKDLIQIKDDLERSLEDINATAEIFRTFEIPDFARETEFVSLKAEADYPWVGGNLISSDGVERDENDYLSMTNEWVEADQTTKWCKLSRDSFAVGALARVNNNFDRLHHYAREVAGLFGLKPVCHNPFMNNVAQLVETVHCTHDALRLIGELLDMKDAPTMVPVTPRAGDGIAAVEVPRGILYHHYSFDNDGRITKANCIIPTTQNNKNIHDDMGALAGQFADQGVSDEKLELLCEMLVRSYDPCISCSVH
ncbi:Ni/Fe hydrogenase subunit alpha [candidate division KSB1 bacterium]